MSTADAIAASQQAVARAEAFATLDVGAGEASATLGSAQATVAYQLVIEILQNKVVELAPALIAVEVAAINEGIAAYLAEQKVSLAIEKDVESKALAAFAQVQSIYEQEQQQESAAYQASLSEERAAYPPDIWKSADVAGAVRRTLDEVAAAVESALSAATSGLR